MKRSNSDEMSLVVLGCGSARPTRWHHPSAQVLMLRQKVFLIDCGEGTQQQMLRYGIKFSSLHRIFISHLHGDHCLGLPGLLSTMSLVGFNHPVHIYGPKGIGEYIDTCVRLFCSPEDSENIVVHEVDNQSSTLIYDDHSISVTAFPLVHRIPCIGFRFDEKPLMPHLDRAAADFYGVPISYFGLLKGGADFTTNDGEVILNHLLTKPNRASYSYAYCSDTTYSTDTARYVQGVDLLYHEATYDATLQKQAAAHMHSTTIDAARVANEAQVKSLMIGHYSARYHSPNDIEQLRLEAVAEYANTLAANEGLVIDFKDLVRAGAQ